MNKAEAKAILLPALIEFISRSPAFQGKVKEVRAKCPNITKAELEAWVQEALKKAVEEALAQTPAPLDPTALKEMIERSIGELDPDQIAHNFFSRAVRNALS